MKFKQLKEGFKTHPGWARVIKKILAEKKRKEDRESKKWDEREKSEVRMRNEGKYMSSRS